MILMVAPFRAGAQTQVVTTSGTVEGLDGPSVISFRGIPFGEAPVGALRWAKPEAKSAEPMVINAQAPALACTQVLSTFQDSCKDVPADVGGDVVGTEDCLTLDVWRPTAAPAMPRPVMVWIHGGALTQGCSKAPANSPEQLTQIGVDGTVVVSIQYRLGALGFFRPPISPPRTWTERLATMGCSTRSWPSNGSKTILRPLAATRTM
jgi:para-nitrobenzyl esterase